MNENKIVFFENDGTKLRVEISASEKTVLLTLTEIAFLFSVNKSAISKHMKNWNQFKEKAIEK